MPGMTSRERVKRALDHHEPDRVPVALGGGPYGLVDGLYFKLLDHFELAEPAAPFRQGHTISYMDDRILERLQIDTRFVWPGASPSSPASPTVDANIFLDGFGQPWKRARPYYYPMRGLLEDASIDQVDGLVSWPEAGDRRWTAGVRERARTLSEATDCYVIARMVTSHGPFTTACSLRGTEQFLIDMMQDPDYAQLLLERVTDTIAALMRGYLDACGDYIDMIELPGDDYASNTNLIVSPRLFRSFIKPQISRLVGIVKSYRSDIKVMLHSDGLIEKLLPDFVEIGVDAVHPLEPVEAMEQERIKQEFGAQLAFIGGIDISHALPGSRNDVIEEVKLRIDQFAPGGGYVLAPSNHLQEDIPTENVVTLFQAAREHGRYPLG